MNVISSLMEIAANPVTRDGKATTPITYDSNCLEEVCGSCAMLINGTRPHGLLRSGRQARAAHHGSSPFRNFPSSAIWRSIAASCSKISKR